MFDFEKEWYFFGGRLQPGREAVSALAGFMRHIFPTPRDLPASVHARAKIYKNIYSMKPPSMSTSAALGQRVQCDSRKEGSVGFC